MAFIYAKSEFTDLAGTDWEIQIYATATGTDINLPFVLGPDGFSLSYDFDGYDRAKPIVGSRVQFTLYHPTAWDAYFDLLYNSFDSQAEGSFWVKIFRDPDNINELFWCGELLPEQTIIPDEYPNAAITLTAVDGLRNLDGIDYNNDGVAYQGSTSILGHVHNCIQKLQISDIWTASDIELRFFEDFIGKEYKDHISGGQNQQLQNATIAHSTFYNLDQDGIKKYFSTYEVLQNIALTFNATFFMAQGSIWFVPLGAIQSQGTGGMSIVHHMMGDGSRTYNAYPNTTFTSSFGSSGATQFSKLAGFERTSCPAFKEAKRTRNYQGDKPVVKDSLYERTDIVASTILDDEDIEYQAPRKFLVSGVLRYTYPGDSTAINGDKIARLKLGVRLRVGDAGGASRYLSRVATFSSSNFLFANFFNPAHDTDENDFFYYVSEFPDTTWSTTAANYELTTGTFNKRLGTANNSNGILSFGFSFLTPEIPADATGLQLSIDDLSGLSHIGGVDTDLVDASADFVIDNFQCHIFDDSNTQEFSSLDITATNPDDARYKFDQGTTLIGDRITDSDLGTISIYNGGSSSVDASEWTNLQSSTASLSINGLGVRERLAANENAKRIERGTLFQVGSTFIHPYTILTNTDDSGNFYQVTGLRFVASRSEYDIECMFLSRDVAGITLVSDNAKGTPGEGLPDVLPGVKAPGIETVFKTAQADISALQTDLADFIGGGQAKVLAPIGDISPPSLKIHKENADLLTQTEVGVKLIVDSSIVSTHVLTLPKAPPTTGTAVMSYNSTGNMSSLPDGAANEFLQTNGSGALSWAAAGGGGGGWHGSSTTIKILPNEFAANDDYSRMTQFIEDDTASTLGVRCVTSAQELYAFIAIPDGYKVTHVQAYASASTASAVELYQFNHTTGAIQSVGSGNFNALIDSTDFDSSSTVSAVVKLIPASSVTIIYGASLTIATI
jgi:hypothetical protein